VLGIRKVEIELFYKSWLKKVMNTITLQWFDGIQYQRTKIAEQHHNSKNPGTVRIGRDPLRCDIVLTDPTVSGLHVEIFFNQKNQCFSIRNLRHTNPPLVDGQQLSFGEIPLKEGSIVYLGNQVLQIIMISILGSNPIPATIITPPPPPLVTSRSKPNPTGNYNSPTPAPQQRVSYGLTCPKCQKISPYEHQHLPCPWCGTSLAAAESVLINPDS
jgi:ssDNA-binding Zn-finger/Zn-ribbon topoisomerase 1